MECEYKDIRNELKTGDIVLFSGTNIVSEIIKGVTSSQWSHVGMVYVIEDLDALCLWESYTSNKIPDATTGVVCKGVQVVSLSSRILEFEGKVCIRKLEDVTLGNLDLSKLKVLRQGLAGVPYEDNYIELGRSVSAWKLFTNMTEDLSSLFCSELVAKAYQQLGLLSRERPANTYTPADFAEEKDIQLLRGRLSKEILIRKS